MTAPPDSLTIGHAPLKNGPPLDLPLIANHFRRKLLSPLKTALWKRRRAPFWHRGAKGLEFELFPGELIDYYIYTEGAFEKRFLYLIEALLPARRTALDVGANIGNHALFFAKIFDQVHAFEPNPAMVARLKRNVARNDVGNLEIHAFGLSDRDGDMPFTPNTTGNAGMGRFGDEGGAADMSLSVRKGDDVAAEQAIAEVDFIKLDVEGHELPALQGLAGTIARDRPVIAFEYHAFDFPAGHFEAYRRLLAGYDFFECAFPPAGAGGAARLAAFLRTGGWPALKPLRMVEKKTYQNILAVPVGRRLNFALPTSG